MDHRSTSRDGYTLAHAVREVFGPDLAWVSWAVVAGCGLLGAACAGFFDGAPDAPRRWAGPFTCAAVGVVAGGLITLVPRLIGLVTLSAAIRTRPADAGDVDRPWWPLRLAAAALANTPPLRRTAQDFTEAVAAVIPHVRGLVGRRLWPACAAAFAAPALGLVGAWQAWGAFVGAGPLQPGRVPSVGEKAWQPMILSIFAALVLMLAVIGVDQWIRRLLQRWATTVRDTDAATGFVAARLGDGLLMPASSPSIPVLPGGPGDVTMPPERRPPPPAPTAPPISSDALEGLGSIFKNG